MQCAQKAGDRNPRGQKLDHARPLELTNLLLREISIDLADRTLPILSVKSS
jgi:hypothetical protein